MSSKEIRKICGNCTSFEKPVLDCLQGKCHYFGKYTVDRFALEDACVSFCPACADMRKVVEIDQFEEGDNG